MPPGSNAVDRLHTIHAVDKDILRRMKKNGDSKEKIAAERKWMANQLRLIKRDANKYRRFQKKIETLKRLKYASRKK